MLRMSKFPKKVAKNNRPNKCSLIIVKILDKWEVNLFPNSLVNQLDTNLLNY